MIGLNTLMWILMALVVLAGIPFTLWWWKLADRWADAEHKRFKPKPDLRERIVVKSPGASGAGEGTKPQSP